MYDRIMLPTDGSAEMLPVVEHAIGLAEIHDATLRPVYVVDTATISRVPMEATYDTIEESLHEEGEEATGVVAEIAGDRVPVEGIVLDGAPAAEIVREAESGDCDVVVMGTHGRGGIDRLLLGSVAERVVRTAPIPVTTVRVDGEDGSGR